ADIICRTVFSVSLDTDVAKDVFDDFLVFERGVAQVKIWRLIVDPAWTKIQQDQDVKSACNRIREHLGTLLDTHLENTGKAFDDIASAVIDARDTETGKGFTREELIDQLGVFFLAGHETTASVLTWVFYILATRPEILARVREEVRDITNDGPVTFDLAKRLTFVRSVFKETLRLYPPITFMPRIAMHAGRIGKFKVKQGALIMIAPWTIHRHHAYWQAPDAFDPDRFMPGREDEILPGTYIPFGLGPHTCVGAGFATIEAALIIARLARRFDFEVANSAQIRPAARLTTRPAEQIIVRAQHSGA
ncbi:MAG: cytochrome P450, partial [Pseudomonadota bacterium]